MLQVVTHSGSSISLVDLLGVIATALAVLAASRAALLAAWRKTAGRGLHARRCLRKRAANYDVSFFSAVLGAHATKRRQGDLTEWVWVDDLYYVQAVSDLDGSVFRWAVTTRRQRFRPRFVMAALSGNPIAVTLNKTRFSELGSTVEQVHGGLGARRWSYSEQHYFGNPGNYQRFFAAISDTAWARTGDVVAMSKALAERAAKRGGASTVVDREPMRTFRVESAPNTYGEAAPRWASFPDHFSVGPDQDHIRVIATAGRLAEWKSRRQVKKLRKGGGYG